METDKQKKKGEDRRAEGSEDSVSSRAIADDEDWQRDWMKGNAKAALREARESCDDGGVIAKAVGKENSPSRIPEAGISLQKVTRVEGAVNALFMSTAR